MKEREDAMEEKTIKGRCDQGKDVTIRKGNELQGGE
jgi:hypothetical protein